MNHQRCPRCGGFLVDAQEKYWKWRFAFKDVVHCVNCSRNWIKRNNTLESFSYKINEYLEKRRRIV